MKDLWINKTQKKFFLRYLKCPAPAHVLFEGLMGAVGVILNDPYSGMSDSQGCSLN